MIIVISLLRPLCSADFDKDIPREITSDMLERKCSIGFSSDKITQSIENFRFHFVSNEPLAY